MAATPENRAPELLGVTITMLTLGAIFVFARTITRTILRPSFRWDDALIIITWFLNLGFATAVFVAVGHGFGKPIADLSPDDITPALRAFSMAEVFAVLTYPTGKASIAYLLLRIFPGRTLKWVLWTFVAGNAILFYLNAVLFLTQCRPVQYIWDRSIQGGSCWNPSVLQTYGLFTGIFGAITDFVFAALPWYYLRGLQMQVKEKICVGVALSMGLLATVCCIIKIDLTVGFWSKTDVTYDTVPLTMWASAEIGLINVAACIPTLRPMYLWATNRNPRDGSRRTSSTRPLRGSGSTGTPQRKDGGVDANIYHVRSFKVSYEDESDQSKEGITYAEP